MPNRRQLFILASVFVSAASLLLILRDVPMGEVLAAMRGADARYLLAAVFVASPLALLARGLRWWGLLSRRLPLNQAAHMVNIMFLGNQLPLRLGEVARGVLAARAGVPLVTSATSIVVERLIDTLVVALLIALSLSQLPEAPPEISEAAGLAGGAALIGFLLLLGLAAAPRSAEWALERILAALPLLQRLPLKSALVYLLDGLKPLTKPRALLDSLFWTALAWAFSLLHYFLLHQALGISPDSPYGYPLGMSLSALSLALPMSIAGLGPFEASIVLTGSLVGIGALESLSLGFLLHGLTVFSYALWGGIGMLALGVSPAYAFAKREPPA
ncbi:MAG: lysylphosphatidylglycerol synthase transmembrane domain-containing protein [Chloroflexi bacterium]|nr:lysylphosphatidylglycerol synthase transmembrane domain-containing protein [Chloroflexota bacterium]MCY4247026.1 lysylphosphatidylglycerol synthase transmembrane domain-containing protein [Chloroflexota bacterium]